MCTFGVLRLSCASPGGPVWCVHSPRAQMSHQGTCASKHHQIPREPQRDTERAKIVVGKGRKRAKFWAVRRGVRGGVALETLIHKIIALTHTRDWHGSAQTGHSPNIQPCMRGFPLLRQRAPCQILWIWGGPAETWPPPVL